MHAQDKRYAAIKSLSADLFVMESDADGRAVCTRSFTTDDRELLAEMIRELVSLGRTERWQNTITGWVEFVLSDECESFETLDWAMMQYAIYAGHDA